jgi:hypothetical protein
MAGTLGALPSGMRTLTLVACFFVSGCITTNTLRPGQLEKLDGYDATALAQAPRKLETITGKTIEFSPRQELELHSLEARGGAEVKGQLQRFTIDPQLGLLQGTLANGKAFSLAPSSLTGVKLNSISTWRTVLLVAAIITGALTTTVGVTAAVVVFGHPFPSLGID